ncbi:MAG TPA: PPOX class F420-dependent oxidoreductase [Acidimicrobiales bacterium]|nr:PPOX class F420-dependent oxidoreductase [Acidimicrobiales bacterium]
MPGDRAEHLSRGAIALIERPVIGNLATVGTGGVPHVTPVWVDHEAGDLLVNTAEGRVKARNMRANPHVAVSIVAPEDPYLVVAFRGTVVEMTTEGADEHIDALAKKYLGQDTYPFRQEGEVRVKVRIRPDRIVAQPVD